MGFEHIFSHNVLTSNQERRAKLMKKRGLKSAKSIIIAAAVCAGLVFGAVSAVSSSESTAQTIVATNPEFVNGFF